MKRACSLIAAIILSPPVSFAQTPDSTPKLASARIPSTEKDSPDLQRRARAISLIEQTAGEAPLWDDREAGVAALTESSDLLWNENASARLWLTRAWGLIADVAERENSEELRAIWRGSQRSRLRTKVLTVALRHDPQLADRLLKRLEQTLDEDKTARGAFDDRTARSEQLLRLAMDALETNPDLSLTLAQRSLQDGISFNLQTLLLRLRQKDELRANSLFDLALTRLANSAATFSESQVLASYLFQPGQVVARLPDGSTSVAVVQTQLPSQTPAESNPVRARNFLAVVHRMILSTPVSESDSRLTGELLLVSTSLTKPFQTYAPDLWQSIQARRAQLGAAHSTTLDQQSIEGSKGEMEAATTGASAEEANRTRVDALEEAALKEMNPIARKLKIAKAALTTTPKEFERAKGIAGKIENDEGLRAQVLTFLYYRAALTFLAEDNLSKAEETALKIPSSVERALTLIAIAQKLAAQKPQTREQKLSARVARQHAIELLFEAEKSLRREDVSTNIAKVRLGKTAISYLLDTSQSLIDFEQAIAVINRLEKFDPTDASAPRLGIEGFGAMRFTVPRVTFGFGFRDALAPLVREDFNRTASAIDGLASPSVRGLCRLEAARQFLRSLPQVSQQIRTAQAPDIGKTNDSNSMVRKH